MTKFYSEKEYKFNKKTNTFPEKRNKNKLTISILKYNSQSHQKTEHFQQLHGIKKILFKAF
ncbi:hypothetical protein DB891_07900 [Flavobacterium laiguense]|uniref:Uncharacterized protein n=1 Tax=Flavobacterium laiguense TaxID=2169409 RepID=A0A2U1JXU2_9FLAO|nr:hypothetical protein DB891_07900 [Flavobacterium laiguense]